VELRIIPNVVGERQWREDNSSVLIEIARREGQELLLPRDARRANQIVRTMSGGRSVAG